MFDKFITEIITAAQKGHRFEDHFADHFAVQFAFKTLKLIIDLSF